MYTLTLPSHDGAGVERVLFARRDRAIDYAARRQRALPVGTVITVVDAAGADARPEAEDETDA